LSKIPNEATFQNQLADKAYVDARIKNKAAVFRGNWDTFDDVPFDSAADDSDKGVAYSDKNDYLVVLDASDYAPEWNVENEYNVGDICSMDADEGNLVLYVCTQSVNSFGDSPQVDDLNWETTDSNPAYEGT
jgi:hypothetical protein